MAAATEDFGSHDKTPSPVVMEASTTEPRVCRESDQDWESPGALIHDYLEKNSPEFVKVRDLRKKGWENPAGDTFFQNQRRVAENPTDRATIAFYNMMKRIGQEMQRNTSALKVKTPSWGKTQILDMGLAPGGFLATAMYLNTGAQAMGFSLPEFDGGHRVMIPDNLDIDRRDVDVTMLAADMGIHDIPADHPDFAKFLPRQFMPGQQFDLVICGGTVVHKQERASYRHESESQRLTTSQLALGLERLRPGGTMVVLFHKMEAWGTVRELYCFSQFSDIKTFKPTTGHNKRSSFYMVATRVQSQSPLAIQAVSRWKHIWQAATFGSEEDFHEARRKNLTDVEEVLDKFGDQLVRKGRRIWHIQAQALEKAPFIQGKYST
ncbi:hypothetical protein CTAM01_15509 [Colletotrichum tamarilloi]|uniref:Ribosomal RNA methyltransferase FtsJ domain-containing protein n=1 Tax=Colletotrichum tamarilloi TaxID=1209934 RepID=A0ABQ9QL91_9PEZI|nr:uncharacterized protein CTAM01_15509 [Colletotrichum tamarilloi]KAK1476319.1 hypothetical protein CTAM01_15509 [Colletotrichum tamarilloi]